MSIDNFKANLTGGGARANQFRVILNRAPVAPAIEIVKASFLIKAAALPGQTITEIAVPFRGRNIYITGDRPAPETWSVTVYNDTDFMIRNAMELWQNGINSYIDNTGLISPSDYQTDLTVEQLDRDDTVLKSYIFRNSFPTTVGQIDLSSAEATEIETFEITWRYQHFEPSGVSF